MAVLCGMPTIQHLVWSTWQSVLSSYLSKWAWPKITSGQSNLTQGALPLYSDGSIVFARWQICVLTWGQIGATYQIRLNCASFGPPESIMQTANRSVLPFLHSSWQKVLILCNGRPFPQKLPTVRQTDHTIQHVTIGYTYTCSTAMRPNNNNNNLIYNADNVQEISNWRCRQSPSGHWWTVSVSG